MRTFIMLLLMLCYSTLSVAQTTSGNTVPHGKLLTEKLASKVLRENKVDLNSNRDVKVYLPPGYDRSGKSYPVVYFCHNFFWSAEKMFENGRVVELLERAFQNNVIQEFILVVPENSTSFIGSLYENSPVSGKWLDYTVNELVPFIDGKFRTIRHRDSRAVVGEFMGGRGALKLAMTYPDVFSVVYALNPVATGNGELPWTNLGIDWKKIYEAKTLSDLSGADGRTKIFLAVSQAFVPNLSRPPFYCDFFMEPDGEQFKLNPDNALKAKRGFLLDETLSEYAANLRRLRGIAFDWGRFDMTTAHVESNRQFSRKLEDLGVAHEAEEYAGDPWNRTWTDHGRFYARMLPFLQRYLVYDDAK